MKSILNSHCLNQVTSPETLDAHFKWTGINLPQYHFLEQTSGPKKWEDTTGKLYMFVDAVDACGTLIAVGKYLKIKNPSINVVRGNLSKLCAFRKFELKRAWPMLGGRACRWPPSSWHP